MSRQGQDPKPGRSDRSGLGSGGPDQNWRWAVLVLLALVAAAFILPGVFSHSQKTQLSYTQYLSDVQAKQVKTADVSNDTGVITGTLTDGTSYTVSGPQPSIPADVAEMRSDGVKLTFHTQGSSLLSSALVYLVPFLLLIGFLVWMNRRAQGQMSGIMSIG